MQMILSFLVSDLRPLYDPVRERSAAKKLPQLDVHATRFIGLSPFVVVASGDVDSMDASPREGEPGVVKFPGAHTLRFAGLAMALLAGCASTPPPLEKAQQLPVALNPSHPAWMKDGRDLEALKTPTFATTYGSRVASRIPEALTTPKPMPVLQHHFVEFFKEMSASPKTVPVTVTRLDIGLTRGKAQAVGDSPGAEGYMGYVGAAMAKMMAQAIADGRTPDYVIVETHVSADGRLHDCGSLSPIKDGDVAQAMAQALYFSARTCGRAISSP